MCSDHCRRMMLLICSRQERNSKEQNQPPKLTHTLAAYNTQRHKHTHAFVCIYILFPFLSLTVNDNADVRESEWDSEQEFVKLKAIK